MLSNPPCPIIDFHMHAFPEKIADRAILKLEQISKTTAYTHGTIAETLDYLAKNNVDQGVIMQIATSPNQQTSINNWAKKIQDEHEPLFCFGSVHPDAPDAIEELHRIKELGLKGIKLHPDYQDFFINEERVYPIYETIAKLKLPLLVHAGWDPLSPAVVHCKPQGLASVLDTFPDLTVIAAHMGDMKLANEVEQTLIHKNCYLDISMVVPAVAPDRLNRMIHNHGADHILFATDCPWGSAKQNIDFLLSLDLTPDELRKIFYKNAQTLLSLTV